MKDPQKALAFLLSLEPDVAAKTVAQLDERDIVLLRKAAAAREPFEAKTLDTLFEEFVSLSSDHVAVPVEAKFTIERLVDGRIESAPREPQRDAATANVFEWMTKAKSADVAAVVDNEPAQLVAAVLAQLVPATAKGILDAMPAKRRAQLVKHIGKLKKVDVRAIEDMAAQLAHEIPKESLVSIDGIGRAAAILNASGKPRSSKTLELMEKDEPKEAERIRRAMFTFADLGRLDRRAITQLMANVRNERLAIALKGANPELIEALLSGMSSRKARLVRDDIKTTRARKSDIEEARAEIITIALRLEAEGVIERD